MDLTPPRYTQEYTELLDANIAVELDEESNEESYARERVMKATWDHVSKVAMEPLGMARTLPWDVFGPNNGAMSWIHRLFSAPHVLGDSYGGSLITGKPMYPGRYCDRQLPGIVVGHPSDSRPTNAVVWDRVFEDWCEQQHVELARSHPGDDPYFNQRVDLEGSTAEGYEKKYYTPVVTKAGSRLWSISFAGPQQVCTDLKACYPGQLLVRLDKGRNMLIYDCFEFVSALLDTFDDGATDVCTEPELEEIEGLLRKTRAKREDEMDRLVAQLLRMKAVQRPEMLPRTEPFERRWRHMTKMKLHHLVNYIRFKKSRLFRIRFPLDAICGARLLIIDYNRPNKDMPAPKGEVPVSRLGESGEIPEVRVPPDSFELYDETIEPLGVLVLELEQLGEHINAADGFTFASTVVWPKSWRDRNRLSVDRDWTPNGAFSKAKRHYIVGDASEMKELANELANRCPRLRTLLCSPDAGNNVLGEDAGAVLGSFNSLSGSVESLRPECIQVVPTLSFQSAKQVLQQNRVEIHAPRMEKTFKSKDEVHDFLSRCGVEEPEEVNDCLKAGLLNGNLQVPPGLVHAPDASAYLDTVLLTKPCANSMCSQTLTCRVRDALYQSRVGNDDSSLPTTVAVNCGGIFCSGKYITNLCDGVPEFTRLNHNHCIDCPDFGKCIGYYRNRHCGQCGVHYTPRHTRCDCHEPSNTRANETITTVDTKAPDPLSWKGFLEGTSNAKVVEAATKKQLVEDVHKLLWQVAMMRTCSPEVVQSIDDQFPEEDEPLSIHMKLEEKSVFDLSSLYLKLSSILDDDNQD